jgi:hypothetical protein
MVYEFPRSRSARRRPSQLGWIWLLIAVVGAVAAVAGFVLLHATF